MNRPKSNAIAILIGIAAIELMALILIFAVGEPLDQQVYKSIISKTETKEAWDFEEAHPYFGFRLSDRWKDRYGADSLNNYYFRSEHDYPYRKSPDEFVIGIFGGSVAHFFGADHEDVFIKELKKNVPSLRDRKIVILNMAMGAAKQPQQFYINSYFIEMFDYVINIDGYNELEAPTPKNFPVEYPYYSETLYKDNIKLQSILGSINLLKSKIQTLHTWSGRIPWPFTAKLLLRLSKKTNFNELMKQNQYLVSAQKTGQPFYGQNLEPRQLINLKIHAMEKFSVLQSTLLKSKNIPHLFFLQPALGRYKNVMTAEENKHLPRDERRKLLLDYGYNYLESRLDPKVYRSLTKIFENETSQIYIDHIHFNKLGNEIMAQAIAQAIGKNLN